MLCELSQIYLNTELKPWAGAGSRFDEQIQEKKLVVPPESISKGNCITLKRNGTTLHINQMPENVISEFNVISVMYIVLY